MEFVEQTVVLWLGNLYCGHTAFHNAAFFVQVKQWITLKWNKFDYLWKPSICQTIFMWIFWGTEIIWSPCRVYMTTVWYKTRTSAGLFHPCPAAHLPTCAGSLEAFDKHNICSDEIVKSNRLVDHTEKGGINGINRKSMHVGEMFFSHLTVWNLLPSHQKLLFCLDC